MGFLEHNQKLMPLTYTEDGTTYQTYGPTVGPGDYKFKDQNGDGKLDENDKVKIGSPYPDFTLGFTGDLSYKDLI